jgi:hypothetical protein
MLGKCRSGTMSWGNQNDREEIVSGTVRQRNLQGIGSQ